MFLLLVLTLTGCGPSPIDSGDADPYADLAFAPAGPNTAPDPMAWGPFPVGVTTLWLSRTLDDGTLREYPVEVWYPAAEDAGTLQSYSVADFLPPERLAEEGIDPDSLPIISADSYADAEPDRAHGPYPLVVFSHGNGAMRLQSRFFTEYLASHGYVVAAPDHVGNTLYDMLLPDAGSTVNMVVDSVPERAGDVEQIVERLRGSDDIAPVSDGLWGVSGHSLGTWTALRAAATIDDVGVVVAMAPIDARLALAGTGEEPDDLEMPVLLQAGTADRILDYKENAAAPFPLFSTPALLGTYFEAGHFTFSDLCVLDLGSAQEMIHDSVGNVMRDGCGEANPDPALALPLVRFHAIGMINAALRDSPQSAERMLDGPDDPEQETLFSMEGTL